MAKTHCLVDYAPIVCPETGRVRTQTELECLMLEGVLFTANYYNATLGAGAYLDLLFITPDNSDLYYPFDAAFFSDTAGTLSIYEAPVATNVPANTVAIYDNNRVSDNTPTCTVTHTPTGINVTSAKLLRQVPFGSAGLGVGHTDIGGAGVSLQTTLMKPNTKYLLRLKNDDSSTGRFATTVYWAEFPVSNYDFVFCNS